MGAFSKVKKDNNSTEKKSNAYSLRETDNRLSRLKKCNRNNMKENRKTSPGKHFTHVFEI